MDTATRQLHHAGELVNLEPKPYAVLEHLVRHRNRIVTRQELIRVVWAQEPHATPTALVRAISKVRHALRLEGEEDVIRTVSRVGYQFTFPWAAVE
jgi:DNA-binding winged helix-turn-helix (wHTH) protein